MSFLGMGTFEILVVLLLAFIFLGPERMVEVARKLGKLVAEVRKMVADLPEIVMDEEPERPPHPTPHIVPKGTGANLIDEHTTAKESEDSNEPDDKPAPDSTPGITNVPNGAVPHNRVKRKKPTETPETPNVEASLDRE